MSALLASTANRLRLVQLDFAEESEATREEYLRDELQGALNRVPHAQRPAFLKELAEYFPTWQDAPLAVAPPPETAEPAPPPDAASLAQMLMEQGEQLPQQKREELLEMLRKAWGLEKRAQAPATPSATPAAHAQELLGDWRDVLGVSESEVVDAAVVPQMFRMLIEFVHTLDPLVVKTWGAINPGAHFTRTDWQKAVARYVRGHRDATLAKNLLELRQLTAAIIGAIPQIPYRLFNQHLARFRPEDIEEAVRIEGSSLLVGTETRCWRKYSKSLASELEEAPVQGALNKIMIELVEPILKGMKGS